MDANTDFLSPGERAALVAVSNYEWLPSVQNVVAALDCKVHVAGDHAEFLQRFHAGQYTFIVMDESFGAATPAENASLQFLQRLGMNHRRHATVLLLGAGFQTLAPWQAYQHSVNAVVNQQDIPSLGQILRMVEADNNAFLAPYRDVQQRIIHGEA